MITELFREPNTGSAIALAALSFVVGAVASCLVCRLLGRCKCSTSRAARKGDAAKLAKRHAPPADGSIEIYVGNLSYDLTEERLRKEFEAFGTVNSARIITNRYNGKSKGFGFVHMPNMKEVEAAIAALGEKDLLGRKLRCNVAKNCN